MFRSMLSQTFKKNLRKICRKYKIKAADIVAGTGLTDSQVAEMYNPSSETGVSLEHACIVVKYLRGATNTLINIDYLIGDHQLARYYEYTKKISVHLQERAAALTYYENNLERLRGEQAEYVSYLQEISNLLEPLDL